MAKRRPFRFSAGCQTASRSRTEYVDAVRRIEQLGYSNLWCPDAFIETRSFGPLTSLMMAAEASPTLRNCTYVLANDFRHPAVLAKEAATLDVLTEGRLELGLGAGGGAFGADYSRLGIALEPGGVRVSRLTESVQVIKGLFGDVPFDFSGTYYTITGLDGTPKPLQRPHPPCSSRAAASGRFRSQVGRPISWGCFHRLVKRLLSAWPPRAIRSNGYGTWSSRRAAARSGARFQVADFRSGEV